MLRYSAGAFCSGDGNAQRWNAGYKYRYVVKKKDTGTKMKSAKRSTEEKNMKKAASVPKSCRDVKNKKGEVRGRYWETRWTHFLDYS